MSRILGAIIFSAVASLGSAQMYSVQRITGFSAPFEARSINQNGVVSGDVDFGSSQTQAAIWQNGSISLFSGYGSLPTVAMASDSSGLVVGKARFSTTSERYHAVTWSGGTFTDLGSFQGFEYESYAGRANNAGWIVGQTSAFEYWRGAMLYHDGTMYNLYAGGYYDTYASAISESNHVVGTRWDYESSTMRGFFWSQGSGFGFISISGAYDINDLDQVVGLYGNPGSYSAALWQGGNIVNLGPGVAFAINNNSDIVGNRGSLAMVWRSLVAHDLNTLLVENGWNLSNARDINNAGKILAYGSFNGGTPEYVVLNPVPELAPWLVLFSIIPLTLKKLILKHLAMMTP